MAESYGESWRESAADQELERVRARRRCRGLPAEVADWSQVIGLALSGGGIRSATTSLGVLQTLARLGLLRAVDVLSTVSGGGYIGAFFMSLFARVAIPRAPIDPYALLAGSFSRPAQGQATAPGQQLWWLRNSGRYLAPTGAGDYVYAIAMQIRNWCGLHVVLGLALLVVAGPVILADAGLRCLLDDLPPAWILDFMPLVSPSPGSGFTALALVLLAAWVVPVGFAFFACQMPRADTPTQGSTWWRGRATGFFIGTAAILGLVAAALQPRVAAFIADKTGARSPYLASQPLSGFFGTVAAMLLLALAYLAFAAVGVARTARTASASEASGATAPGLMQSTRVMLTKELADAMRWALIAVVGALAVGASHYIVSHLDDWKNSLGAAGAGAGALLVVVRQLASFAGKPSNLSVLKRIPLDALALAAGGALFALLVVVWFCLAWAVVAMAAGVAPEALTRPGDGALPLAGITALMLLVGLAVARSFQFINMSTLQSLYASRLTRAYLGATNAERIIDPDPRWTRISDPHPADDLPLGRYYDAGNGAPLHLINVTLNETVSPTDPLVQRDRHGRPMSVTPGHYAIDGQFVPRVSMPAAAPPASPGAAPGPLPKVDWSAPEDLSLGQWISISGAAFSTGVGRQTSLGKSLTLGLANVRLGHWWRAGALALDPVRESWRETLARGVSRLFETQTYLFAELMARFGGRYARYWYLSDGGHFENLGVYELLRRRVGLVIACDNGADPDYDGEDVANAMRLARIDFGCEFFEFTPRLLRPLRALAPLADALLTNATPGRGEYADDACMRLLWACPPGAPPDDADAFIAAGTAVLLIKPRLIQSLATDVRQYAHTHATFPQETTADQFFTEEQWESYRKLGQTAAALLGRLIAAPLVDDADALGRLAAWRHALGHVAASSLADPAATIAQTPALERAMAQAAAAAKR